MTPRTRLARLFGFAALMAAALASVGAQGVPMASPGARPGTGPFPVRRDPPRAFRTLRNGLTISAEHQAGVPLVSAALIVATGWEGAPDFAQAPRAAAVIAAVLARRASSATPGSPGQLLRAIGASVTVTAEDASLTMSGRAPASQLEALVGGLARLVTEAPSADSVRAAGALADQQRGRASMVPWTRAEQEVRRLLYDAPSASSSGGASAEAGPVAPPALRPTGAVLLLVGEVDPSQAVQRAATQFEGWRTESTAASRIRAAASSNRLSRVVFVDRPGSEQATVAIGVAGPPVGDARSAAFDVFNVVYGGYTNSRLFRRLVQDKGWSYGPLSQVRTVAGATYFLARADSRNATVPDTAREMTAILDGMAEQPVGAAELLEATTYLRGTWLVQGATAAARLTQLSNAARAGIDASALDATPARVAAVSARGLVDLARDMFRPDRRVVVVIGDHARLGERLSFLGETRVVPPTRQP